VNASLGFSGRDTIRVLLVGKDGQILWSTSGPATAQGQAALQAAMSAAQ
jgi:hypothetical protein